MIAIFGIALGVVAFAAAAAPVRPPVPGVHAWTNSVPRAFLKDRHLRLYSGTDGERVLFKAEWQKSRAVAQDYSYSGKPREEDAPPEPFQGYFFKVLTRQAKSAPDGKYDYLINGNMIGGFALVAWPAEYGESGIMTFIVNQQGRVYQKNLGSNTGKLAPALEAYDPDPSWSVSRD